MRWPGANPRRKRLASCAVCWMRMKEAEDDDLNEFCFSQRDAGPGMGSVAFSLAGNCCRSSGCGCYGIVPACLDTLCGGRGSPRPDAARSLIDFLPLFTTSFRRGRNPAVVVGAPR